MAMFFKFCRWAGIRSIYGPRLAGALLLAIAFCVFASAAKADNWTGAGQAPINQTRDWNVPANWLGGAVPPPNDSNWCGPLGEGTINLNALQWARSMTFAPYNNTIIAPGVGGQLGMLPSPAGNSFIQTQEGVRDTYGVDYFTEGPQFTASVSLNVPLSVNLGQGVIGANSAMMFSGNIIPNLPGNTVTYNGSGGGTSLWISSNNNFNGDRIIISPGAGSGGNGYTMHLADVGRVDNASIDLQSSACYLGLQDNRNGGPIPAGSNIYFNSVNSYGGNIYADRSYQLNDLDTTINVEQYLTGGVTVYNGVANFGSTGPFGRTNNGFDLHLATLNWDSAPDSVTINVNNGNLTEGRGGSRYVSGANRLQEPNNYTYVSNLWENQSNLVPFTKGGSGVLAVYQANGVGGRWWIAPQVNAGVLRLGYPAIPQNAPAIILNTADSGAGIGWDTQIVQRGLITPFPIIPLAPGLPLGQSGAVDVDLWNFGWSVLANPTIDTNVNSPVGQLTYLRIGSSMGGDASFDTQPLAAKHASIAFQNQAGQLTTIVPYWIGPNNCYIYYFGGGGGTLRVDSLLPNYVQPPPRNTMLEMGTTGTLLPGRVALDPGGDSIDGANTYTGKTDICAGTLQLMKQGSVWGTSVVNLWTYDLNISSALYANPSPYHNLWEGVGNYTWTGPGQLLLDPSKNGVPNDWDLNWYTANGGLLPLINALQLNGGVIGWTGDVVLPGIPGSYGAPIASDLNPLARLVNVLGLGGEYSSGTMTTTFTIGDTVHFPVLLYKAGKNSTLDLTVSGVANTYSGGTIIAGGEIIVNDSSQLNAQTGGNGGPIAILNGGRLHITSAPVLTDRNFDVPIKVVTSGTPDTVKNCGSVIDVDSGFAASLMANFDFSLSPSGYLEKDGPGTLVYFAGAPVAAGISNAWGIKLTNGIFETYQLPVNPGKDSGPVIFNGGNMYVLQVSAGVRDTDPAYGFRNIVSYPIATSISSMVSGIGFVPQNTVTVFDNAMFRSHGIVPNQILGAVHFVADDRDSNPYNNVVDLSRNMAPATANPGDFSQGNGLMSFQGVMVYMSGGGPLPSSPGVISGPLNVLPHDAGFTLELDDGVVFNASHQNYIYGAVKFNNVNSLTPVQIDGEEANPTPSLPIPPYYKFGLTKDTWNIYGTGLTSWSGKTEKIGAGKVTIDRSTGAPVIVNTDSLLQITGGTFEAGGTADPFTDNTLTPGLSLDIVNNSTAAGLLISQGVKNVDTITGVGNTTISGPAGTELIVTSIEQNTITIGAGCTLTISAIPGGPSAGAGLTPVPEPATWIMLVLAAAGLSIWPARKRIF